jgi:hypothetical protein
VITFVQLQFTTKKILKACSEIVTTSYRQTLDEASDQLDRVFNRIQRPGARLGMARGNTVRTVLRCSTEVVMLLTLY